MEHPLDTGIHFFFFDKLTPVSLLDALSHRGTKASVLLQQAQCSIFHQLLGVRYRC